MAPGRRKGARNVSYKIQDTIPTISTKWMTTLLSARFIRDGKPLTGRELYLFNVLAAFGEQVKDAQDIKEKEIVKIKKTRIAIRKSIHVLTATDENKHGIQLTKEMFAAIVKAVYNTGSRKLGNIRAYKAIRRLARPVIVNVQRAIGNPMEMESYLLNATPKDIQDEHNKALYKRIILLSFSDIFYYMRTKTYFRISSLKRDRELLSQNGGSAAYRFMQAIRAKTAKRAAIMKTKSSFTLELNVNEVLPPQSRTAKRKNNEAIDHNIQLMGDILSADATTPEKEISCAITRKDKDTIVIKYLR